MKNQLLKAAVIGLGKAGSMFDEEPRPSVWSHTGAFLALQDEYQVVGGADTLPEAVEKFRRRCPDALASDDMLAMIAATKPDVVSVSTPPRDRAQLVEKLLSVHRPKVIICEKALELDAQARHRLISICQQAGTHLLVHYNRRYHEIYRKAHDAIASGQLGRLTSITVHAPNRLWSIGSHAINLLLFLAGQGPAAWSALTLPMLKEQGEPAVDFTCRFPCGAAGRVLVAGFKNMLYFEVDIVGENGRIHISDNGTRALLFPFIGSSIYVGYKEMGTPQVLHESSPTESSFVGIAAEAAQMAHGLSVSPRSTAQDAMTSETLLDQLSVVAQSPSGIGSGTAA